MQIISSDSLHTADAAAITADGFANHSAVVIGINAAGVGVIVNDDYVTADAIYTADAAHITADGYILEVAGAVEAAISLASEASGWSYSSYAEGAGYAAISFSATGTAAHGVSGSANAAVAVIANASGSLSVTATASAHILIAADATGVCQGKPKASRMTLAPWRRRKDIDKHVVAAMPFAVVLDDEIKNPWVEARSADAGRSAGWPLADSKDRDAAAPWGEYGSKRADDTIASWTVSIIADTEASAPWGVYQHKQLNRVGVSWVIAKVADIDKFAPWARAAAQLGETWVAEAPRAIGVDDQMRVPWGMGRGINVTIGIKQPPVDPPPVDPHGTIIVPSLRAYIVLNDITLVRASNSVSLPALSLSITADADSWTFQWGATVPGAALDDVLPDTPGEPIEFMASVNGWPYRLLAEKISLDSAFGKSRINITGRGVAARLASPYIAAESRNNATQARNASQLCEDALLINGVPASGWGVVFNLTDWLVPAGAWTENSSPMDAIVGIAEAGGGYVRTNPLTNTIYVDPKYPLAPWDWTSATPDYILPSQATTKVGISWTEAPPYNAVYVSGTGAGAILAQVKRTGTAGDIVAPMVTDPLITHANAARQRGLSILGTAGSGQTLSLETPIIESIGPYPIGSLVQFTDGATNRRGVIRSCSINASMPKVRQTIEIECHG